MNEEFTDREKQFPPDTRTQNVDVGSGGLVRDMQSARVGEPSIDYDVRSTYDVRPINAYDFNITGSDVLENDGLGGENEANVSFVVRQGRVMVPLRFHHWVKAPLLDRQNCTVSVQVNGADVADNTNIPVGSASDDLVRLFLVLDEFSILNFKFLTPGVAGGSFSSTNLYVHLYGTYLLTSGRPAQFEIANPTGRSQKSSTQGPRSIEDALNGPSLAAGLPSAPQLDSRSATPQNMSAARWANMSIAEQLRYGQQFKTGIK